MMRWISNGGAWLFESKDVVEPNAGDSDYRSVGRAVALIPSSWAVAKMGQESGGDGMGLVTANPKATVDRRVGLKSLVRGYERC